ncbi:MAG: phosphatase PAP2 family protein [Sciscionella sp.]
MRPAPKSTDATEHVPHARHSIAALGRWDTAALVAGQRRLARPAVVRGARALSHFGEHAIGWLALGGLGAACDRSRRGEWMYAGATIAAAHGASIVLKRVLRRHRPQDPRVRVLVATPSRLSMPSSHATSTTAAAIAFSGLLGTPLMPVLVPPMAISRLVLGVHYPADVASGIALGALIARVAARRSRYGRGCETK